MCPYIRRGIVIMANISSVVAMMAAGFAIFCDIPGIVPLKSASATDGYCKQSQAAAFVFDVVVGAMAIVIFITTCLSLIFPSCFNEINIDRYRRDEPNANAQNDDPERPSKHDNNPMYYDDA